MDHLIDQEITVADTEILQIISMLKKEEEKTEQLEKALVQVREAIDLVKNAAENMKKLQASIDSFKGKLIKWQGNWEPMRQKLIEEFRNVKFSFSLRAGEVSQKKRRNPKDESRAKFFGSVCKR